MEIKIPEAIEVIEFNTKTRQRRVHKFVEYDEVVNFIKKRRDKVSKGYTYTICDIRSINTNIF